MSGAGDSPAPVGDPPTGTALSDVVARENFRALDVDGDWQINATEFLTQPSKDSKRYHFFGDTDKTNDGYISWDRELFQQPGWQLFWIRF